MKIYKLFIMLLIILCIISSISVINASNDFNNTNSNNESTFVEINNLKEVDFQKSENNQINPVNITIMQSENIPIKINGNASGTLNVLIDNKYESKFDFEGNDLINIPTYDKSYFDENNASYINLNPGFHKISFKFYNVSGDVTNVYMNNSILNFNVIPNPIDLNKYSFSYESSINVLKKDKTVHILNIKSALVSFDPYFKIEFEEQGVDFLMIFSKDGEYIDQLYMSNGDKKLFEMKGGFYSKIAGVFNLTVVNLKDGTYDSSIISFF